jgi:hypothetical protein
MLRAAASIMSFAVNCCVKILPLTKSKLSHIDSFDYHFPISIAIVLEEYAAACISTIYNNRIVYNESVSEIKLQYHIPELGSLHLSDSRWNFINRKLSAEITAFSEEALIANGNVMIADIDREPSVSWVMCSKQCAKLGRRALTLATVLRNTHRLNSLPSGEYLDRLAIEMCRIEEDEAAWQARWVRND